MSKLNTNIKATFSTIYDIEPVVVAKIKGTTAPYSCSWEVTSSVGDPTQHKILAILKDIHPKYTNVQTSSIVLADNEDAFRTDRYEAYETRETVLKLTVTDAYNEHNTFIYTASVEGYSTIAPNEYVDDGGKFCGSCNMQKAIINDSLFDFLDNPNKQPPYNEVYNRYTENYPYIPTEDELDNLNYLVFENPYGIDTTGIGPFDAENFYFQIPLLKMALQNALFKNNHEEARNQEYPIYVEHQKVLEGKTFTSYKEYIEAIKNIILETNKFDSFNRAEFKNYNILLGAKLHKYENLIGNIVSIKSTIGEAEIKFLQALPMPVGDQLPITGKAGEIIIFYNTSSPYTIEEKWAWHPNNDGPGVGGWNSVLGDYIYDLFEAREVLRVEWITKFDVLNRSSRAFTQAAFSAALHRLR